MRKGDFERESGGYPPSRKASRRMWEEMHHPSSITIQLANGPLRNRATGAVDVDAGPSAVGDATAAGDALAARR